MNYFIFTTSASLTMLLTFTALVNFGILAQTGSMSTLQNSNADYAVSIVPGAAQKDSTYHYYPPKIAVPVGTTVAWFNNDVEQPHTVTSGEPGAPNQGSVFNSGLMPATANSFFQFTFSQPGEYLYHCNIHPWRVASVHSSNAFFTGNGFKIGIGSDATWNIATYPRVMLNIEPQTIPLDGTTPVTYNVTIGEGQNNTIFSRWFTTAGEPLMLELISFQDNQTTSHGPDFSSSGAYHIQSNFKNGSSYPIEIQIVSVNNKPIENPARVLFELKTT
ncbi:MAG TPA: plastocyanin/azurin family copper-binding protein [Nitrososphaeraceae archaeon]|nr:plastocyanin/azurin family copper-binding protein [Nitrososphaeraceae archaeon]